jgi:YfiH family protein
MFRQEDFMGRRVLKSSLTDDFVDVEAFFTTRDLPLKNGEREDLIQTIEDNKKLVSRGLGISSEKLFIPIQTHSDNIRCVDVNTAGCIEDTDALVTNNREVALALNFADCVPLIFYDPIKKVIASAHAGWRGTVAKIGVKTVNRMVEEFGSKPSDIIALIGPAIGLCCFEVGEDVLNKIVMSVDGDVQNAISDNHADLKMINKIQLLASGLKKIDVCEYCTSCNTELFYSYRKEKGHTARHSAVIALK